MYKTFVTLHNLIRWVVLILGGIASIQALLGWFGKKAWTESARKLGLFFTISVDIQLLLGIILYFVLSEWGLKAILTQGMGEVMGSAAYRFYAVEHAFIMLFAFIFAHLGSALPKRAEGDQAKFKRAALWIGLATIIILLGIPWDRPLLPGL
jgi:hypothetical protein